MSTIDEIMGQVRRYAEAVVRDTDWASDQEDTDACDAEYAATREMIAAELAAKDAEIAECDALRADMASILRGPEVDGISWGWADLPSRTAAAMNMMAGAVDLAREYAEDIDALKGERDEAHGELIIQASDLRLMTEERDNLRAQLADAERKGAEAMQAGAFDACVAQADADRRFAKSERNAGAVDCATELAEIIRALPLPTGPRQAVLLTDAEVRQIGDATLYAGGIYDRVRAIETAVLAANGLGVRRG